MTIGESCTSNTNLRGVCIELPQCNSLITLYNQDRSQRTIDVLIANQRSCNNRKVGRNPLMCCSDGVPQNAAPPLEQRLGPPCLSPDNINGYCINVKQCPTVLNTFIQRQKDPEYVAYIRQSNANCNYASQVICCPNDAATSQTTGGISTRSSLLTPAQCGVSKVPHNRVVGGAPAIQGKQLILLTIFISSSMLSSCWNSLTQFFNLFLFYVSLQEGKNRNFNS